MPNIPFPSVPKLPGVPSIPRSASFPPIVRAGAGLLQGMLWRIFQVETRWGIFDSTGKALGDPSTNSILESIGFGLAPTLSTSSVEFSKETRVSDFPIELGSFASYNKVECAATPIVTLALSGSEKDRTSFLDAIDKACKSTDLFSVVTPEVKYLEYSIERYNYQRRSNKGTTLLIVEIALKEIRQVSAKYSQIKKPKDASATPKVDTGKVQPAPPRQSVLKSITNKLGL